MPSQSTRQIVVYLVGSGSHWTARAYADEEDGKHIWSSEDASSADVALREIGEAVSRGY